ncbi:sarcosine oxidase subunit gamma [Pontitalea aquivivens]|uniref:sarcosine oxidase subunit gamma n=1 Tax=Pontitalea aquivivens TaxID=3388663 RepID=UPI003971095F
MSDAVSALNGRSFGGFARVAEAGLQGMITIRCDLASKALAKGMKGLGLSVPAQRRIVTGGDHAALWMSPDELLVLVPYAQAADTVAALEKALAKDHALISDVSDARAMFRVSGARADQVLMKLCPVDFATLAPDEVRRTRAAQVAAALWRSGGDEVSVICFRSVAGYVMGILEHSARPGSELFPG